VEVQETTKLYEKKFNDWEFTRINQFLLMVMLSGPKESPVTPMGFSIWLHL